MLESNRRYDLNRDLILPIITGLLSTGKRGGNGNCELVCLHFVVVTIVFKGVYCYYLLVLPTH